MLVFFSKSSIIQLSHFNKEIFLFLGDGRPSDFTAQFCEYKPKRLFRHPHYPKWFISCDGATATSGICLRCDPQATLELNEDCQMCLRPGESMLQCFFNSFHNSDYHIIILNITSNVSFFFQNVQRRDHHQLNFTVSNTVRIDVFLY